MSERRLVIAGFMGCGKTAVGRTLAEQLACEMTDLDSFITKRDGRSPAEIIRADGEPAFRAIESVALSEALQNRESRIIALGGGTWTIPANRTLIALHDCLSIWLDVPFQLCWQRISAGGDPVRPLAPTEESAQVLYESRRADYRLAELQIEVSAQRELDDIASEIIRRAS